MTDVFMHHSRARTHGRGRNLGEIPLSTGEIEYLKHLDDAARRRERLLQVRAHEKRAAQLVTQRYRDNLKKLQSYRRKHAQQQHNDRQAVVLSALHEKYQFSLQGMGTAQRNAREKIAELTTLAQHEKSKWAFNRYGEKERFDDAVDVVHEDAAVRSARRREIARNLVRLKHMAEKQRSEASARAKHALKMELQLQRARNESQRYRLEHAETEEFSCPRKTEKDVSAYYFTRTHCVALPTNGGDKEEVAPASARFKQVKVVRHNRTLRTMPSAMEQAEAHRQEMEQRREDEWRLREENARIAASRGEGALHTLEAIRGGERAIGWLESLDRHELAEASEPSERDKVHAVRRVRDNSDGRVDGDGSGEFARLFGIDDSRDLLRGSASDDQTIEESERVVARRVHSFNDSSHSSFLESEKDFARERDRLEHDDPVLQPSSDHAIEAKIEAMNDLLKRATPFEKNGFGVNDVNDPTRHPSRKSISSQHGYDEWKQALPGSSYHRSPHHSSASYSSGQEGAIQPTRNSEVVDRLSKEAQDDTTVRLPARFPRSNFQSEFDTIQLHRANQDRDTSVGAVGDHVGSSVSRHRLDDAHWEADVSTSWDGASQRSFEHFARPAASDNDKGIQSSRKPSLERLEEPPNECTHSVNSSFEEGETINRDQSHRGWRQRRVRVEKNERRSTPVDARPLSLNQLDQHRERSSEELSLRRQRPNRDEMSSSRYQGESQGATTLRADEQVAVEPNGFFLTKSDINQSHQGHQGRDLAPLYPSRVADGDSLGSSRSIDERSDGISSEKGRLSVQDACGSSSVEGLDNTASSELRYHRRTNVESDNGAREESNGKVQRMSVSDGSHDSETLVGVGIRMGRTSPHIKSLEDLCPNSDRSSIASSMAPRDGNVSALQTRRDDSRSERESVEILILGRANDITEDNVSPVVAPSEPTMHHQSFDIQEHLGQTRKQRDANALNSSSSSVLQYSLPLSDSFSSINDSLGGGSLEPITNTLVPIFPPQNNQSEDRASVGESRTPPRDPFGDPSIQIEGLEPQDLQTVLPADNVSGQTYFGRSFSGALNINAGIDPSRRAANAGVGQAQIRGMLSATNMQQDLSFSSDTSSDVSAFVYLEKMRQLTGLWDSTKGSKRQDQPMSDSDSMSNATTNLESRTRDGNRPWRRDSAGSSSSSTPSMDARFQYLVNMTAVAGRALPLHLNLLSRTTQNNMQQRKPLVDPRVYSSDSDSEVSHRGQIADAPEIEADGRTHTSTNARVNEASTQQSPAHPMDIPLGAIDLSIPPSPILRSSSGSVDSRRVRMVSDGDEDSASHPAAAIGQFDLKDLSQRLASLPPPPFGDLDMSQPPAPLPWIDSEEEDEGGDEAVRMETFHSSTGVASPSHLAQTERDSAISLPTKDQALNETNHDMYDEISLADAFRTRHPGFHRRTQSTKELLTQRREQLEKRRAAQSQDEGLVQIGDGWRARAPPTAASRLTASAPAFGTTAVDRKLDMPSPQLLNRLATGQRAKISQAEMRERTRRLYYQLPEVTERKRQEDVLDRRRQRLAELREREKTRRQQQRERQVQTP